MYVVTGGGTGIGRALTLALVARGHSVLIVGRRVAPLIETAALSDKITYVAADVTSEAGRKSIVECLGAVSRINGLIHNAGIIEPIMPLHLVTPDALHACIASHIDAPVFLTNALRDKLKFGRVLHIGSGASTIAIAGLGAYCVAKAGLAMLTRCWQVESTDIAFASVKPGIIDTDMQDRISEAECMTPERSEYAKQLKKNQQLLQTTTVASFLAWLLLDITTEEYSAEEWDIYDTKHHAAWLSPQDRVPQL